MVDENRIEKPDGSALIAADADSRTDVGFICPHCAAYRTEYCCAWPTDYRDAGPANTISCMAYDRKDGRSIYWVRENRPDPNPL